LVASRLFSSYSSLSAFLESVTDSPGQYNMKFSAVLPALMTLPLLASAHFTLDYPTSRGFDEDIEPRAFDGLPHPGRIC
jgi:hypothetical protein